MAVSTYTQPDNTAQSGTTYKTNIDGAFDSGERIFNEFAPRAQATPNMTIVVDPGRRFNGIALFANATAQSTATIVAPVTNPRIDRVVIDRNTGTVSVITGTEAASPSAPAITADKVPVAQVSLVVGQTTIVNADITDERDLAWVGHGRGTVEAKTAAFTVANTDNGKVFNCTSGTFTVTLTAVATLIAGFEATVVNSGTGVVTLDGDGAETIDGATTLAVRAGQAVTAVSTGAAWRVKWAHGRTKGRHMIWLPARVFIPFPDEPCANIAQLDPGASVPIWDYLAFDGTTAEAAYTTIMMPPSWDASTVAFRFHWTQGGADAGVVAWVPRTASAGDGEVKPSSYAALVGATTDTAQGQYKEHRSPESAAYTIEGSPAALDLIHLLVFRRPDDAADTLAVDAWLLGVEMYYTTNAETDD